MREQTRYVEGSDATHVVTSINADPFIEGVKALSEKHSKTAKTPIGSRYVGSIDPVTAEVFARECGAAIGTREFAIYAKKRLNSDFSKYKAHIT
jgi:hypothetical protein